MAVSGGGRGGKRGRVHNRATRAVFSVETPSAWNTASTETPSRFHRQTIWPLGQSGAPLATLASNMALRAASALPARLPVRDSRFTSHRRFTFLCSINSRILLYTLANLWFGNRIIYGDWRSRKIIFDGIFPLMLTLWSCFFFLCW